MRAPDRGLDDHLTREEEEFIKRYLSRPESFPPEFWRAVMQKVALDGEPIPQSQVIGLAQLTPSAATAVDTAQSTTSTSYTDLATAGPTLEGLSNGSYLVTIGCVMNCSGVTTGHMAVSENGAAASDDNAARSAVQGFQTAYVQYLTDLRNSNNNTLTAKYRVAPSVSVEFSFRRLFALKVGN